MEEKYKGVIEMRTTYSLNKLAYLMANDVEVTLYKDATNKTYGTFEGNERDMQIVNEYVNDVQLHKFLNAFKEVKIQSNRLG